MALCFKHLFDQFPWLESVELWKGCGKVFTIQEKKLSHFKIQETYGLKALNLVKAAVTRWLFYGTACKHCVEDNILLLRS